MYINGYVMSVPERNKSAFTQFAELFATITREHGAWEVYENWECDVPQGTETDFRKAVKAQADEKVVFAWVTWPDQETSQRAHATMWDDERWPDTDDHPVNTRYLIMGGFTPLVVHQRT